MNSNERFEVKAEAFRIMTGHMAPGKDPGCATWPAPFEERQAVWTQWLAEYGPCVNAVIMAVDSVIGSYGDFDV